MDARLYSKVSSHPNIPCTAVPHKAETIDHYPVTVTVHTDFPLFFTSLLEEENQQNQQSKNAARTLISPPCAVAPLKNSSQKNLLLLGTSSILKGKYPESSDKAKSMCHKEGGKNRTLQPKSRAFICNKLKRKMASRPKITNFFLSPLLISISDCSACFTM